MISERECYHNFPDLFEPHIMMYDYLLLEEADYVQ
jgi:hypothetical protein